MTEDAPPYLRELSDDIVEHLAALARGDEGALAELDRTVDQAIRAAVGEQSRWQIGIDETLSTEVGQNIKRLRDQAGWTQQRLAEAMSDLGWKWRRVTVAEVESSEEVEGSDGRVRLVPRRRISFEELLHVVALFGVPMVELLLPQVNVDVAPEGSESFPLESEKARELILGRDGVVGRGGARWHAALCLARAAGERPAPAYWTGKQQEDET